MGITSRKFPRVPVNLPASVRLEQMHLACRLLQLGQGGALMEFSARQPLPERFSLAFELPGAVPMTVQAAPRFRRERGGYRPNSALPTMGCQFLALPEPWRVAIAAFVARQREALRQLQFSLALSPPPPKAGQLLKQVGAAELSPSELQHFVRWCSSAA